MIKRGGEIKRNKKGSLINQASLNICLSVFKRTDMLKDYSPASLL